jgi:hypothetical protein
VLPTPHPPSDGGRAVSFIIWLAAFALVFGTFVVFAGPRRERKPHFWLRVLILPCAPMLIAAMLIVSGELHLLPDRVAQTFLLSVVFLTIPGLMLVPALLYRRPGPSPGPSEDEGGGGPGPEQPPARPTPPIGGIPIPLPDAEQSRTRLRGPRGPQRWRRPRRPAREPQRLPARTPARY